MLEGLVHALRERFSPKQKGIRMKRYALYPLFLLALALGLFGCAKSEDQADAVSPASEAVFAGGGACNPSQTTIAFVKAYWAHGYWPGSSLSPLALEFTVDWENAPCSTPTVTGQASAFFTRAGSPAEIQIDPIDFAQGVVSYVPPSGAINGTLTVYVTKIKSTDYTELDACAGGYYWIYVSAPFTAQCCPGIWQETVQWWSITPYGS